jgi:phosphoenolpyruvate carboxylase
MATKKSKPKRTRKWSARVTETSNALDLKKDIFKSSDPKKIAASLKSSAEHSRRRKAEPYRSAMSMLTFYINRAGDNLSARQRNVLEKAKPELRKLFGREEQ